MGAAPATRERRLVSLLFCDLVGFTAISEARDHEDVRDVLEDYFVAARRAIGAYGGTIEKFIGDAVMAVWGAPVARENDAERSVRAALDLTSAVAALAQRLSMPELQVRVGLVTGEATVDIGREHEGMVIGDAVNTAARIQSVAEPGTVLVDDMTRLACERTILFEPIGTTPLRGKSQPVRVWRAIRGLAGASVAREGPVEVPLVAREVELETLKQALDAILVPEAGLRTITVTGETGVGKSRLAWEFEKHAEGVSSPIAWCRGRAVDFGEGASFGALAEMVRTLLGVSPEDSAERQRTLVEQATEQIGSAERERVARALRRLLELDDGRELIEQGELFSAWRALFEQIAARRAVVLVFEDLQSADQALLDYLGHMLEWARAAPILIVALGRQDQRLESIQAAGEQIELGPLSDPDMDRLVAGAVEAPPEALLTAIREEGGGNPLYAVETLRGLADRGVLAVETGRYVLRGTFDEVAVPPTIRALVTSRLDRLGQLERRALDAGAVLGERFTAPAVAALAGIDALDARTLLDGLAGKALLRLDRDPRSPSRGRYGFLQGAVRRVTLSTLARRERKRFHLAAADHLCRDDSEPERAAALASHLLEAIEAAPTATDADEIRARAGQALGQAAERAAAVGALAEALRLFDRAVELIGEELERATTLERAGAVAHRGGEADAAAARYRRAGEVHAAAGRERELLRARAHELRALRYVRSPAELLTPLRELDAQLADERDAISALAGAVLAFTLYQCGQPREALEVASRAIDAAQRSGARGELLQALSAQATALAELERPEQAIDVYARALKLAIVEDPRRASHLAGNLAVSLASIGRYAEAAARAREAITAAERTAERFIERWARLVLGRALCSLGEWDEAVAEIESVIDDVPTFQIGMATAPLVVIALARGESARAVELAAEHDRRCSHAGASVFESDFRALRGLVVRSDDRGAVGLAEIVTSADIADYAEWSGWLAPVIDRLVEEPDDDRLEAALGALRDRGAMKQFAPIQAQAARLDAHLAARCGDQARARACWARAETLANDCGLVFERAVIVLECVEHRADPGPAALSPARGTLERLGATPWVLRLDRLSNPVAEAQEPGGSINR